MLCQLMQGVHAAAASTRASFTLRNNCITISINLSIYCLYFFLLRHLSLLSPFSHICPLRKWGWPTARRQRRRVPPPCPLCSTGCSWTTTSRQTRGTLSPPQRPVTSLLRWTTRRSTSPPWRPTSPTEFPPRSAHGQHHGNSVYLVYCGRDAVFKQLPHGGSFACCDPPTNHLWFTFSRLQILYERSCLVNVSCTVFCVFFMPAGPFCASSIGKTVGKWIWTLSIWK